MPRRSPSQSKPKSKRQPKPATPPKPTNTPECINQIQIRINQQKNFRYRDFKHFMPAAGLDEAGDKAAMLDDFEAMGFDKKHRDVLMRLKEPVVDSCTQVKHLSHNALKEMRNERLAAVETRITRNRAAIASALTSNDGPPQDIVVVAASRANPSSKKHNCARVQIPIGGSESNWVLFDPVCGWPPFGPSPPQVFVRYSKYTPGNRKIVAFNIKSYSLGLKTVPDQFLGHEVKYEKNGPRLVKIGDTGIGNDENSENDDDEETYD